MDQSGSDFGFGCFGSLRPSLNVPAAYNIVNTTDEELVRILRLKTQKEELEVGVDALMAAANVLRKKRATASHFGNGGEVANLLSEAKLRKENRRRKKEDTLQSR